MVESTLQLLPSALELLSSPVSSLNSQTHERAVLTQQLQAVLHAAVDGGVMDVNNAAPLQQLLWLITAPAADASKVRINIFTLLSS